MKLFGRGVPLIYIEGKVNPRLEIRTDPAERRLVSWDLSYPAQPLLSPDHSLRHSTSEDNAVRISIPAHELLECTFPSFGVGQMRHTCI